MDIRPTIPTDATSSSAPTAHTDQQPTSTEHRPVRSSARVKAAKQKQQQGTAKHKARETTATDSPVASSSTAPDPIASSSSAKPSRLRDSVVGKGKGKEIIAEGSRTTKRSVRFLDGPAVY